MIKPESKRPIALEDLLRLKRAERPPPEFWAQFDRDLRAKQLAALVARRPWWQWVPSPWPLFARHRILIGASAVLAVTFVSLRIPRDVTATVASAGAVAAAPTQDVTSPLANVEVASIATKNLFTAVGKELAVPRQDTGISGADPAVVSVAAVASGNDRVALAVPAIGAPGPAVDIETQASAARFVVSGLVMVGPVEATVPRVVAAGSGFEGRAMPARTTEPLQQMISPNESRRARMLTAMVATASLETSARTAERVANRIEEERLYDQVHRIGARGDRLSVKF